MANNRKKRSRKTGLSPGSLIHIGEQKIEFPRITLIQYDRQTFTEGEASSLEECASQIKDYQGVSWVNIDGIHEMGLMGKAGELFGIHPLTLEDIVNTEQRPKAEAYDSYLFFSLKMLSPGEKNDDLASEQISILLGERLVITFQERPGDVFDQVRERLRQGKGRIRTLKADYLAYALLDALVDSYFDLLERLGEEMEDLEELVLGNPSKQMVPRIHNMKRRALVLRRSVWPLRELVNTFEKSESSLLEKSTRIYLRDVYDHTIQIIDGVEVSREIISGLMDLYLSSLSNRTNEVMKVLTIVATIFIPLTFLAGVYGMNFKHMPELAWKWAYPAVWGVMALAALGMLWYFRRKKWL
ncbi:MAG: magnesium/cobalt transporter CorA [Bacteroides sp.]|jgi:magnesium transporter|nr:magnesium/cobalt transporter CorA [Bacteroides sp.]